MLYAGIGNEDVDPSEAALGRLDPGLDLFLARDVNGLEGDLAAAARLDVARRGFERPSIPRGDGDASALGDE